ncbi:MAG: ATP-binding protein [Thermodesulfobacteriota bacterium]
MLRNQRLITVSLDQDQLGQRNRALSVLLKLSNQLSICVDLDQVWDISLSLVMEEFGVSAGRVYLMQPGGDQFQLAAFRGLDPSGLETVYAPNSFTGKAARDRSFLAMHVEDLGDRRRAALLASKGFKVVICLPLITRDRVLGVMNLAARKVIPLEMSTIDLSMVMGNLTATAAESVLQARLLNEQKEAVKFFAYTACHDMKSPAGGVHALVRRLAKHLDHSLDEKGRVIMDQIERAAGRLEDLTQEVNHYIRAKEAPLEPMELELGEVLAELADELAERLQAAGVELALPPRPLRLTADRAALARALMNLLDNALKYGGPQLSRIEVSAEEQPEQAVIKVRDDGQGVPPELADKLFTLFKRAATSQGTEGTGLGLAIVKEIAQRHGGQAWLEPVQGRGAAFCFSLSKKI